MDWSETGKDLRWLFIACARRLPMKIKTDKGSTKKSWYPTKVCSSV